MCTAEEFIERKGGYVVWLPPEATVMQAAKVMNERHIGSVLVMNGPRLVGIFTERDILRRIVAAGRDPQTTLVHNVMTTPVACAMPHSLLDELRMVMRAQRIRHIPVLKNDHVIGLISIGDLNQADHDVQEQTIQYLEQYMSVM